MKIYLIRHAEAEHLKENWLKKVSYQEFVHLLLKWENVSLTDEGKIHAEKTADLLLGKYDIISCSPLLRTRQTADLLNQHKRQILFDDSLKEIIIYPPKFLINMKFSINSWIYICALKSLLSGEIFKLLKEAKEIYNTILTSGSNNILIVSHSARIRTLILYAHLNSYLKVVKKDYHPCGISEVEFCLNCQLDKAKNKILNVND